MRAQLFLAGELAPVFKVGRNIGLGPYYIYARGLEKDIIRNSHFISFRANVANISLGEKLYMKFFAQAYYLKLDDNDGFYLNSSLAVTRRKFPFSLSSTVNQKIRSTIPGDDFLWNINFTYSFSNRYKKI